MYFCLGSTSGCQFVNCNFTDSVINISTILPATQGNGNRLQSSTHQQLPSQDEVIKNYLLRTQQQLCRNAIRFTPATLNTRYNVDIAHMFTDLDLLKENEKKQDVKPTTLNEVLNIIKSTPACKVLIEGEGGIGKSTLLRYIAYNWATESDKTFKGKIVFLVNISTIDKSETFLDGILKQIDIEDFYLETTLSQDPVLVKRFIRNHDNDIVLLLDGLDELKEGSKSPICLFKKEKMPKCKVILTSRPEKIDEFVKESSIHVKVKGFSAVNIRNYIKKHFEYFKEPALGDSLLDELGLNSKYKYMYKHDDVISMCKNPMLLLSVCIMWEERQHLPADKADLFKEIFKTILNQFIEKQADKEQKISVFTNIPQKYVKLILLLGKCMYNGLKRNQLSINKADLEGREEMVALALKLGFVYKDTPNLKSDFEEIYTAPHKLIVESLVGFYLCKLCQAAGLESECSVGMNMLLQPVDDNEWKIIRENTHLHNARVFAIGFLGTGAGMFFNHWITNNLSTYRSLMLHFKFVKIENRSTVVKELFDEMTKKNLEIMPHINDICESLRKIIHHFMSDVEVNEIENFLQIMQIFSTRSKFSAKFGRDMFMSWFEFSGKEMSPEEKCKMIAHIMIAVSDQSAILHLASKICGDDIKYLTEECQKLNFKYDITEFQLCRLCTASFIIHLFSFAPQLYLLVCFSNCITGAIMNDVMKECCRAGVKLELMELYISNNNLSDIDGSLLASLLAIASTLSTLKMSGCSLSGVIVNDMMRECCRAGVKLKLMKLDISGNNLSNIDGSFLTSLLVIAPTLSILNMSGCSLSGVIVNDMMRECCRAGVKLKLMKLNISDNNLSDIDGSLLASLLAIASTLSTLKMSGCSLSGVIVNDMMRECCRAGVKLKLMKLDIRDNKLSDISCTLLASLLAIVSTLSTLNMSGCSLSGVIVNDMMRECCSAGVKLELMKLDISDNNLSNIDGSLLASLLAIASTLSTLKMSGCSLSGVIVNDMMRECCSAGVKLELMELDISDNNLSNIDGSLFVSFLGIISKHFYLSIRNGSSSCIFRKLYAFNGNNLFSLKISGNILDISGFSLACLLITIKLGDLTLTNCSLSGVIVNDMMRECCSAGVKLELMELNISDNNLSDIDGSLLASLLAIASTLSTLKMSGCSLSGVIVNDMMRECCSAGVKLELIEFNISDNNLSNIDGSLLASLLAIAPTLSSLNMSGCSLSGVIVNDMMRERCIAGVKLELMELDISGNNLSNIDGSLLASLLAIAPTLSTLNMSGCSLSGVIVNDMMRECCRAGVKFELMELYISDNNLCNIDGSLLASLLAIASTLSTLKMSGCSLSGVIVNDMMRECCSAGVKLELSELIISVSLLITIELNELTLRNCSLSGAVVNDMIRECCSKGVKTEIKVLDISDNNFSDIDCSLLASLLAIASQLRTLNMSGCSLSGVIVNDMMRECCSAGVKLELIELNIHDNNLSNIDGSLLASLLVIAPILRILKMSGCSLSGVIVNDMMRECCSAEVKLNLMKLNISDNNLSNIDGSLLASLLAIASTLSTLNMSDCSLSGVIVNDMMRECCSKGVKTELNVLDISDNNLSNIDGSLLASLLVIAPILRILNMSGCSLSDVIVNDMMRECCSAGVKLELMELNISDNNLSNIDGSLLASLLVIAPKLSTLNMSGCSLSGVIVNDMMRECCSAGVKLKLLKLNIGGNNLSNIDNSLLASLLVIAPKLIGLYMSGCSLSGVIVNDMMRECCSAGVKLELIELNISGNNLSNIDGSLLASLLVIAPMLRILNMSGCSLSGVIVNDMMRECCSAGVTLYLMELNISNNNLSNIDGSLLASLLVIAPTLRTLNMSGCSLSGVIVNDMMRECCSRRVKLKLNQLDDTI
ncbi:uncharacterized protein LOC117109028 [Anneissia japonica]|uniref:uncharacterized protein LOC117109028 n=1 Tax=Anneissia japonica TaxID=1529436 RepID=UPI0014259899|nr:uncharacterized protein LOC117109028 [Anneissia japonica]